MIHEVISRYITAYLICTKFLSSILASKVYTENKNCYVAYIYQLTIYLM